MLSWAWIVRADCAGVQLSVCTTYPNPSGFSGSRCLPAADTNFGNRVDLTITEPLEGKECRHHNPLSVALSACLDLVPCFQGMI